MKYFEVEFENTFSVACKGLRVPSDKEASKFCAKEVADNGEVISVIEIPLTEVETFFDVENISKWPIFE